MYGQADNADGPLIIAPPTCLSVQEPSPHPPEIVKTPTEGGSPGTLMRRNQLRRLSTRQRAFPEIQGFTGDLGRPLCRDQKNL